MAAINKVIKVLILSDAILVTGLGFAGPIFAIFLTENISGNSLEVAGFAAGIFWIVKSITVIPIGKFLDRNHGAKGELWLMIIGNFLVALSVFGYLFSYRPWHIYFLQVVCAFGVGLNVPGYMAIFTRHINKGKESSTWSARSALMGIGIGASAAIGGIIANKFGFNLLFIIIGVFIILSAFLPLFILNEMRPKDKKPVRTSAIKTMP